MEKQSSQRIYLDYQASTPVGPQVLEAMQPFFSETFGNESSKHGFGYEASLAVEKARASLLKDIGSEAGEKKLIFTSGATESNNLVIKGLALVSEKPIHVISQKTEHKCVLESLSWIQSLGHEVTLLEVDANGLVSPDDLKSTLKENTKLVSIMHANNEIGTIQDLKTLVEVTRENSSALFHTDAAQSVGKILVDVKDLDLDFLSFSGHKMYGPKGVGGLYRSERALKEKLVPLLHGGGHEFELRSGTLNVPGVVGLAKALEVCLENLEEESNRLAGFRDQIIPNITQEIDHCFLNGHPELRLSGNINLCIEHIEADQILAALPNIAMSTGSACSAHSTEPSYVIQALGRSEEQAKSSLRLSLGRFTTQEEVDQVTEQLISTIKPLREKSLKYQMIQS